MLELLLLVTFLGVFISSYRADILGNPFQIYFSVWFLVFFLYRIDVDTFVPISAELGLAILYLNIIAIGFLLIFVIRYVPHEIVKSGVLINEFQDRLILLSQFVVTGLLPFVFFRASSLASGESVLTIPGYIGLRYALTEGGSSYGWYSYFFILSFVVASVNVFSYRQGYSGLVRFLFSIAVALVYAYLSTGRTFILLFLCLIIIPLVLDGVVGLRGIVFSVFFLLIVFIFIAGMSDRGVSVDGDVSSNIDLFLNNIRSYTVAPLLAFSDLFDRNSSIDFGVNSFRFFISLAHAIGLSSVEPVNLVKDYAFVPDPTNVYTVYEVYFKDFSYFGMLIPIFFLLFHLFLYKKARSIGGYWIFYYAASVYPLIMQFFQDQYFSLLSVWLQMGAWYWLFLGPIRKSVTSKDFYA